jgi:hypothetical protein
MSFIFEQTIGTGEFKVLRFKILKIAAFMSIWYNSFVKALYKKEVAIGRRPA